jgi:hypothetical protein
MAARPLPRGRRLDRDRLHEEPLQALVIRGSLVALISSRQPALRAGVSAARMQPEFGPLGARSGPQEFRRSAAACRGQPRAGKRSHPPAVIGRRRQGSAKARPIVGPSSGSRPGLVLARVLVAGSDDARQLLDPLGAERAVVLRLVLSVLARALRLRGPTALPPAACCLLIVGGSC